MYLPNKYTKWYDAIICNARHKSVNPEIYYEVHHVVPRSLHGDNSKENLVRLTAREHYVCHRLLTKMTIGLDKQKMAYAFWRISTANSATKNVRITSHAYNAARTEFGKNMSERAYDSGFNMASLGKIRSTETKTKLKNNMIEVWADRKANGWEHTPTEKTKASVANLVENWDKFHTLDSIASMKAKKTGKVRKYLPGGKFIMVDPEDQP